MANSSECRYSRSIRGSRSVSRIQFPTCFRFRCSRTHVRGKEERETERGVGVCCVDTWTEGKQRMKEWLRESRERERACMYVRKRRKKIKTRSKKVKRCYTRREKKKKKRIYESLTCFVYVFTLYKIIERIIAIKNKDHKFHKKKKKIIIDRTFAVECISLTFFLFLFLPTVSQRFQRSS